MKTTKKQIIEATRVSKGQGFLPEYSYVCDINGFYFEKRYDHNDIYVSSIEKPWELNYVGEARVKKEFIEKVYNYLNQ